MKAWTLSLCGLVLISSHATAGTSLIRSRQSGPWSAGTSWEGGEVPSAGARVQVRDGHTVLYDQNSAKAIHSIHVAGTLTFAKDRNTRLDVGLIKIQPGDDASENGFDCEAHVPTIDPGRSRPTLEVGTAESPIEAGHVALIRLVAFDDMDRETCPAIVCCGGRMDFHGAPMPRTWVKLGASCARGDSSVTLSEPVPGWREGDHILLTAASLRARKDVEGSRPIERSAPRASEERTIRSIDGTKIRLDRPLNEIHSGSGDLRGEVANLSRNVVIESADPERGRGHTMYHRNSAGSISYAEFRHLGKEGVKGRYPIHFHLVGQTMRGSSVIGASIWDSGNRWITIHGTNELVVRDCVGFRSIGHGFFLEDGTETLNVLDHNLAVQSLAGKALPDQALPFDDNSGAGFWWANSLNTFTQNVAVECDRYGFRYEAGASPEGDLKRRVLLSNGKREAIDIRKLPFVKFEGNEAHGQIYGLNLGEGTEGVGPDRDHPFELRNTRFWECLWAFRPEVPNLKIDQMTIDRSRYGVFHATGEGHSYRELSIRSTFIAGAGPTDENDRVIPDNSPPSTIVTFVGPLKAGKRLVRGTATDNRAIRRVVVNGQEARAITPGFGQWEVTLSDPADGLVTAHSEDSAGNMEADPHKVKLGPSPSH